MLSPIGTKDFNRLLCIFKRIATSFKGLKVAPIYRGFYYLSTKYIDDNVFDVISHSFKVKIQNKKAAKEISLTAVVKNS